MSVLFVQKAALRFFGLNSDQKSHFSLILFHIQTGPRLGLGLGLGAL